jgi:DNA-binding beta-propeller fold protein YncE
MRHWHRVGLIICISLLLFGVFAFARPQASRYRLVKTYPFGPAEGSTSEYFDYINVDSNARRVYLSRGTAVQVINADTGAVIGNIAGFKRQHGVAIANDLGRGFISDGGQGKVTIFDLKTLKVIGEAKSSPNTDSLVYEPSSKRVFTMNGDSKNSTVIDAKNGEVVTTIDLGGAPEFCVTDGKGIIYADLASKNEVITINASTLSIASRWSLAPAGSPTGLAIDREHRRLFSAGRNPQVLVVIDADNGKMIQSFPIGASVDAVAYDPATKLVFVSTRDGMVSVFHQDLPDKYSPIDTIKTEFGAKTMGLDTKTHKLFLDTSDFAPAPPASADRPNPQPSAILGTFRVLVYGR